MMVTSGVVLVTLSRNARTAEVSKLETAEDLHRYAVGISMMVVSLFCTGFLGLLQERTYGHMDLVGKKVYFIRYENVNYGSVSKLSLYRSTFFPFLSLHF